jgi:hypothetical protein
MTLAKHAHAVPPWPRRDAALPRLPIGTGKSGSTTLLPTARQGIGFTIPWSWRKFETMELMAPERLHCARSRRDVGQRKVIAE